MNSEAARGRASSNSGSYGGAEPGSSLAREGGGAGREEPRSEVRSSRRGVEVRRRRGEEDL